MRALRGVDQVHDLTRGPGRVAQALAIDRQHDGLDLCGDGPLWLGAGTAAVTTIGISTRIGISRAVAQPWRFYVRDNACVSGPRRLRR